MSTFNHSHPAANQSCHTRQDTARYADPSPSPAVHVSRTVEQIIAGRPTSDGAGVKLTRIVGQSLQRRLDPFLMLDAFGSDDPDDYIAGFPDHPHRGFETLTYMIAGRMRHRDSAGHEGVIDAGGVQWMKAGRGIVHSERPEQSNGRLEGFQLWLNLPAKDKMQIPDYRDIPGDTVPTLDLGDQVRVRVILGASRGVAGCLQRPITEPLLLDVHLAGESTFSEALPASHNAFIHVYRGAINIGQRRVEAGRTAVLSNTADADGVVLFAEQDSRLLLIAGRPLREPIAQHGPFVMNTEDEIRQTLDDYRAGRFGGNDPAD